MLEKSKIIIYIIYLHKSIVIDPTHHVKKVFFINNSYSLTLSRLGGRGVESYPLYFFLRGFKYVACGIHPPPPFQPIFDKKQTNQDWVKGKYDFGHKKAISRSNKTQNTHKQAVLRVYGPNMCFVGKFLFCYCQFKLKSGIASFIIILMEEDLDLILNVYNCIILFINDVFVIYSQLIVT